MESVVAYPFGTPSSVIEPLDLADVKSYLSIRSADTSQDAFLQEAITMCRATMEPHLPYYILTGTVKARTIITTPRGHDDKVIIAIKGPIRTITSATVTPLEEASETVEASIVDECHIIVDLSAYRHQTVRFDITYTVGSAVDYGLRTALLTMVHNRYDRRYEDPYTEEVRRMVYPYMRLNA